MEQSSSTSHSEVEGHLSVATLLCNLFRTDINPDVHTQESDSTDRDPFFLASLAHWASQGRDFCPLLPITGKLSPQSRNTLFHERIHYWQVMSCPLQQFRFIASLDRLRLGISRLGGEPDHLCGQALPRRFHGPDSKIKFETTLDAVDDSLKQADALFRTLALKPSMTLLHNVVSTEPFTDMPYILIPVNDSDDGQIPGYGAVLGFPDSEEVAAFPFNGRYLFESAAYISEVLFKGQPLPQPRILRGTRDQVYVGVWEFWRRLHGSRYKSEGNLAIGFLAAVDLALTSDAIDVKPTDGDYEYEMFSLPYRFGKLAYRLLGFPTFEPGEDCDPAEAVNDYQQRICSYFGWPAPAFALKKMMVFITQILLQSCAPCIPASERNEKIVLQLLTSPFSETAKNVEGLEEFWALIEDARKKLPPLIGMQILGAMLNACKYRLEFPGRFALPHAYNPSLAEDFPLPILQMDGEYYLDETWGRMNSNPAQINWPFRSDPFGLLYDCLSLMTIRPVQNQSTKCGFLEEVIDCWYIKEGLGCPQKSSGYTTAQKKLRDMYGLEDWCHWTPRAVMLRYASGEIQNRWRERWHSAANKG